LSRKTPTPFLGHGRLFVCCGSALRLLSALVLSLLVLLILRLLVLLIFVLTHFNSPLFGLLPFRAKETPNKSRHASFLHIFRYLWGDFCIAKNLTAQSARPI